jgi:hypothetical protein
MKKIICALVIMLIIISIPACRKSVEPNDPQNNNNTNNNTTDTTTVIVPFPQTTVTHCPGAPDYGDSIIYMQPSTGDYIVSPINHPDTGKYFAWPVGMDINKNTGAINVTHSEGGLRYSIGYVKNGTTDTCMQTMILAGVSYPDSIYVLNSSERYAEPYFNANPSLVSICSGSGIPGSGLTCMFDVTGQATSQHIDIDHNTGVIDLKNTLNHGAFGLLPLNGATIQTTISYKLNDNSNMAMQRITVNFIYFNRKADVPPDLLAAVEDKLNKILQSVLLIDLLGSANKTNTGNPRPPIIIVTRFN